MPASVDDTNYDIWLEHSSAKVGYRLARDENSNVMLSTGAAPFTAPQIFSGEFSLESTNINVDVPIALEKYHHGAGFSDFFSPFGYSVSGGVDASWPGKLYASPLVSSSVSTTEAPIKFLYSSLGLFCMTTRYVLEWTGAAWTTRLDAGASATLTDIIEFKNSNGTFIVVGVVGDHYYISTDGVSFIQTGSSGAAPTYRSGEAPATLTNTTITITKPAGTVDGDVLIATVAFKAPVTVTIPAGWTQAYGYSASSSSTYVFWKRASSEGASYAFTWSASTTATWAMAAYQSASTSGSPFDFIAGAVNTSTTSFTTGTGTISGSNRTAVALFCAVDDTETTALTASTASGYTSNLNNWDVQLVAHQSDTTTTAGALSAATSTISRTSTGIGVLLVLRPISTGFSDVSRWAVRGQTSGEALLWAVDSRGDLRNTPDPLTPSAWSAADALQLGESNTVSGLEVVDNVFYLFTSKGIISYDGTTVGTVWNNTSLAQSSTDARPFTWVDKSIYFTYSGVLYRYAPDSLVIDKVWPRGAQIGHPDLSGTIQAITGDTSHLYFIVVDAGGEPYVMKCDPYVVANINDTDFTPVHSIQVLTSTVTAALVVPASSSTFSTTNPQLVYGHGSNSRYFSLPTPGMRPEDDGNYLYDTSGYLRTSWLNSGSRAFNKFLNTLSALVESATADRTIVFKYNIQDDGSAYTTIATYNSNGLNTTTFSTDIEYQRISFDIVFTSNVSTAAPRLAGAALHTSLNPDRKRQWELYLEVAEDSELLGGGAHRHGARYLDTHLFNGLTERVKFYDRLGNSFITKILDISSVISGEDKDIYKVTLVQLV